MEERAIYLQNYSQLYLWAERHLAVKKSKISKRIKKYSYQNFKEHTNIFCHTCFRIVYVCFGFLQFFAIHDVLLKGFHHDNIIVLLFSLILAFLPVFGPFLAIFSSIVAWDWNFSYAVIVFILPYLIVHSPLSMITIVDIYKDWKRWQAEKICKTDCKAGFF